MRLAEHFTSAEFACRCGCGYGNGPGDVDPLLLNLLEALRAMCGRPILVNSGCRCIAHDLKVGQTQTASGARGRPSFHVLGRAADITGPPGPLLKAAALGVFHDYGVGLPASGTWLHVDTGPMRRWRYD